GGEQFSLIFSFNNPMNGYSELERCNAFRPSLSGWSERLSQKVFVHSLLNPLQLCPNHELGLSLRVFKQSF
ncbi:hypothetical protein ACU4A3_004516, partial [Shigella sonnei]